MARQHRARGFTITEAVFAAGVITIVLGLLVTALEKHQGFATKSAEHRDASWHVEGLMTQLQTGQLPSDTRDDPALIIQPLTDQAPHGSVWVRIDHKTNHGGVSLIGLVPEPIWNKFSDSDETNP